MPNLIPFDVLIVYASSLAVSASNMTSPSPTPFRQNSDNATYNTVYSYFLKICRRFGLKAAFTTSADIVGPGSCRSFWKFSQNKWAKINKPCYSTLIFDKFSPTSARTLSRRQLLFSSSLIKPFNDPTLFNLFFDKLSTYQKLSNVAIPTISVKDATLDSITTACTSLTKTMRQHSNQLDFTDDIIMKDRFGAGGRHVYKFNSGRSEAMLAVMTCHPRISFIIQPFAKFDQGFSYQNCQSATDIRLIYLGGKVIQSYIRVAQNGDFRCNEHQGGTLTYLSLDNIPQSLVAKSNTIAAILNKSCSLYALDFIISNNGNTYLLEGNTGPGLDWNMSLKKNTAEAKKLIRLVVSALLLRSNIRNKVPQKIFSITTPLFTPPQSIFPSEVTIISQ